MNLPIAITAYNRPHYLRRMLESLAPQVGDREVCLFLDGERVPMEKELVEQSGDIFREMVPGGKVFSAARNLGVAKNVDRARRYMFGPYDFAIFLEDDVVLQLYYIELLERLVYLFGSHEYVGAFSAFGEYNRQDVGNLLSYDQQHERRGDLVAMDHFWAYAMSAACYREILPTLEEYFALLPADYRNRPDAQILDFFASKGLADPHSSQDTATEVAMLCHGFVKLATITNNLTYIGAVGEHSRQNIYNMAGYPVYDTYDQDNYGPFSYNLVDVVETLLAKCRATEKFRKDFRLYKG